MSLSAVLTDSAYQAADDSLKTFYVQNTDTKDWWLDVDEPGKIDVVGQKELERLRNHNKTVLDEKKSAASKLAEFEKLGKSPDEIKTDLEANRPQDLKTLIEKYEAEKTQLKQSYEEPLNAAQKRAQRLEGQVQQSLTSAAIAKLVATYGLDAETGPIVLEKYIRAVAKDDDPDEFTVRVFDETGQPALVAGQEMTPEQLIKGWQESGKYKKMIQVGTGAGTGTTRTTNLGASKNFDGLHGAALVQAAREQQG